MLLYDTKTQKKEKHTATPLIWIQYEIFACVCLVVTQYNMQIKSGGNFISLRNSSTSKSHINSKCWGQTAISFLFRPYHIRLHKSNRAILLTKQITQISPFNSAQQQQQRPQKSSMRIVKANENTKEIIKWQQTIRITLFQMSARHFKCNYTSYGSAECLFWLLLICRSRCCRLVSSVFVIRNSHSLSLIHFVAVPLLVLTTNFNSDLWFWCNSIKLYVIPIKWILKKTVPTK